jgi:hypothetical protein
MVLVAETEGIEAHLKINWSTKFQCKNWFILSQHNIYKHQQPNTATCFDPFLDHPQANIYL